MSVWGTAGYGVGDLSLTPAGAAAGVDTDLRLSTAALGGRGVLSLRTGEKGTFELALRSGAMLTETRSDASGNLMGATGATSRVRLVLEGTGSLGLAAGGVLTPTLETGLRYDGGDAETGAGLEIGGGLGYSAGRLSARVNARMLVVHEDAAYEEWGFGGSLSYKSRSDGRGLSMQLGSTWGEGQSGVQSLWSQTAVSESVGAGAAANAAQRLHGELGYGLHGLPGRALWVPYVAADAARALSLGVKLKADEGLGAQIELGRRDDGRTEHVVQFRASWGW